MNDKYDAILNALHALLRGVAEPTIVLEDDGSYSYIPGAYLSDVSYQGSRDVVATVSEAAFGSAFDLDTATEEELEAAARWAAANW